METPYVYADIRARGKAVVLLYLLYDEGGAVVYIILYELYITEMTRHTGKIWTVVISRKIKAVVDDQ